MLYEAQRYAIVQALARGEAIELTLWGLSMRPLVPPGTRLRLEPARADELVLGDLALIQKGEDLLLHRVSRIGAFDLELSGDSGPKQVVPHDAVLARAPGVVLFGRQWRPPEERARRVNRALLLVVPWTRRRWVRARNATKPLRYRAADAISPWLVRALGSRLRTLDTHELPWLERAWLRRGREPTAEQRNRWKATIRALDSALLVTSHQDRLLVYVAIESGTVADVYVHPRLASPRLKRALAEYAVESFT